MAKTKKRYKDSNQLFYGDEPVFVPKLEPHSNVEIITALSYYNVQLNQDDAKAELLKHAEQFYSKEIVDQLEKVKWVGHVGSLCRMQSRGCIFSDPNTIHKKIVELLNEKTRKISEQKLKPPKQPKVNKHLVYARILIDYIEEQSLSRTFVKPSVLKKFLHNNKIPEKSFKPICPILLDHSKEVRNALDENVEGYATFCKKDLRQYVGMYDFFIEGLKSLAPKSSRKPRQKKPIDLDKKLAKVKFCKEFAQYKSIAPKDILGKNCVLLYSIRYKTFTILQSKVGFDIRGSTIYNLDEENCFKKVLRKPDEMLKKLLTAVNINGILNVFNEIGTKVSTPVGSLNENILIMKVL
jgi:hypothetical protein